MIANMSDVSRPGLLINDYSGDDVTWLGNEVSWRHTRNPFKISGTEPDNVYIISCYTKNRTIHEICAQEVAGDFKDRNDTATLDLVAEEGWTNWCQVYRGEVVVNDEGRNTWDAGREHRDEWEACFDRERGEGGRLTNLRDVMEDSVVPLRQMNAYTFRVQSGLPSGNSAGMQAKVAWTTLFLAFVLPVIASFGQV